MNIRSNFRGLFGGLMGRQRDAAPSLASSEPSNTSIETDRTIQERRSAPRRYGDPVEVRLRSYDYADATCGQTGWVRDRSQGGLALTTEKPLDIGSWLRVRPTIVPDDVAWVDVLVRDVRPQGPRWVLGCQFVELPPRELLLLFR